MASAPGIARSTPLMGWVMQQRLRRRWVGASRPTLPMSALWLWSQDRLRVLSRGDWKHIAQATSPRPLPSASCRHTRRLAPNAKDLDLDVETSARAPPVGPARPPRRNEAHPRLRGVRGGCAASAQRAMSPAAARMLASLKSTPLRTGSGGKD
ncbi:hypothetical protein HYPSUDRAFT_220530 [Hypholoma sublateritium FD-334 SS-4]|uniref:Uncharacterized protein n=1 Tax=Hypholoma sublateritium (strain FD-334 SS-4) TaxID=945553 RepID=A0A0D2N570_HYPSF|nr:hypothetical protein HYPSUDRAFT_220530 [Hypholoma sublateritium FD-334 SS-4]